jgi:hypothetical protein
MESTKINVAVYIRRAKESIGYSRDARRERYKGIVNGMWNEHHC